MTGRPFVGLGCLLQRNKQLRLLKPNPKRELCGLIIRSHIVLYIYLIEIHDCALDDARNPHNLHRRNYGAYPEAP